MIGSNLTQPNPTQTNLTHSYKGWVMGLVWMIQDPLLYLCHQQIVLCFSFHVLNYFGQTCHDLTYWLT